MRTIPTPQHKEEVRPRRNWSASEICQGTKTLLVLLLPPICKEPHTEVQLAVPLREITLKKSAYFFALMRAHEHAFTFGSSTSTFFQRHIVNCTGLEEEKVKKSGGRHRALWVRRRTRTAAKTGVCNSESSHSLQSPQIASCFCPFYFFFF